MAHEFYEGFPTEEKTIEVDGLGGMSKAVLNQADYVGDDGNKWTLWEVEEYQDDEFMKVFNGNKAKLYFQLRQTQMDLFEPVTEHFETPEEAEDYFHNVLPSVDWYDFAYQLLKDELEYWSTEDVEEVEKEFWETVEAADRNPLNI